MLNAGVPIIRAMQVLEAQTENGVLKQAVTTVIANIRQGSTLSDAFDKHPKIFFISIAACCGVVKLVVMCRCSGAVDLDHSTLNS